MNKKNTVFNPWNTKKIWLKVLKQGLQVLFHIVMAKFPIPENCSVYVPMILKEFCSTKINGLVMRAKTNFNTHMVHSYEGGPILCIFSYMVKWEYTIYYMKTLHVRSGPVPHSRKLLSLCSNDFKGVLFY
jgi:hypothetical protein